MKPSEAIRQRAAELFRERYMIAMPCMAPGEEAILEWIGAYTADQAGKRPGEPVCQCATPATFGERHPPDCKWLKWVESKRVAPVVDPALPPELFAAVATRDEDCGPVVEPVGERICGRCGDTFANHALHNPDECQAFSDAPQPVDHESAKEWRRLCFEARTERDTALADVARLERELAHHVELRELAHRGRDEARAKVRELEAKNAELEEFVANQKRWLERGERIIKERDASLATVERQLRVAVEDCEAAAKERDDLLKMPSGKYFGMVLRATHYGPTSWAELVKDVAQCWAERDTLRRQVAQDGAAIIACDAVNDGLRERLATVERERSLAISARRGIWSAGYDAGKYDYSTSPAPVDEQECPFGPDEFDSGHFNPFTSPCACLGCRENEGLKSQLSTVERELGELKEKLEQWDFEAVDDELAKEVGDMQNAAAHLQMQLSTSNTEAERLRSELETAQQRLAEGVEVMNARQSADRAEIARLRVRTRNMRRALRDLNKSVRGKADAYRQVQWHAAGIVKADALLDNWGKLTERNKELAKLLGMVSHPSWPEMLATLRGRLYPLDQPAPLKEIRVRQTWKWAGISPLTYEVTALYSDAVMLKETTSGNKEKVPFATFYERYTFVSDPPAPATVATDPPAPPSSETAGGGA